MKCDISVPCISVQNSTVCVDFILNLFKCGLIGEQNW